MLAGGVQCLVTGGAGFIGSHVATRLAALGCRVRVVDDLSTGDESNLTELAGRIEFLRGDLCDPEVCRQAVEGVAVVFHLAAIPSVPRSLEDPWRSHDANVNATMRLLGACRKAGVRGLKGDGPSCSATERRPEISRSSTTSWKQTFWPPPGRARRRMAGW